MIRIIAIVVVSFATGVPAGYFLAITTTSPDKADRARQNFFNPVPAADPQDAQEMNPRW